MFAGDANWGRIVMAIGKAGVAGLDPAGVGIMLDDVVLLEHGQPHPDYEEAHGAAVVRSEEHTSELQSLMRISYAVFCLKKKNPNNQPYRTSKPQVHT